MDVAHPLILERKRSERYCMPRSPMPPMKPIGPGPAVSSQMGCRVRALSSFSDLVEGPPSLPGLRAATALIESLIAIRAAHDNVNDRSWVKKLDGFDALACL